MIYRAELVKTTTTKDSELFLCEKPTKRRLLNHWLHFIVINYTKVCQAQTLSYGNKRTRMQVKVGTVDTNAN
jgi:hypothetical protein